MSYTPWHTDQWFTSPWNFAEKAFEVGRLLNLAEFEEIAHNVLG